MSTNLTRIGDKARAHPDLVFTSLYHHIADIDHLRACYRVLKGNKAVGVDEVTKARSVMNSFTYMRSEADRVWQGSPTVPLGNGLAVLCKHPRDILPRNLLL